MALLLSCQALEKSFGTRVLFERLTFGLDEGDRVGLIGPNGAGKSTLLKILCGLETPDGGTLSIKRAQRLCYVPQEDAFPHGASAEMVLTEALRADALDEHERTNRIETVFSRIGFSLDSRSVPVETLSGGWRKRVAIARELVREPDLLLMDEPTNHLDLEGILWLENLLTNANFACLMVSHDRLFLEHAASRIFELNRCYPDGCFSSPGRYSDFLEKREEFLSGQRRTQKTLESKVRREIEWLKRGARARITKSRARIDSAGRLIGELAATKARNSQGAAPRIDFTSAQRQANKLLVLKKVSKSLGGRKLIDGLDLVLAPGMKLGLLGSNGSGKTTCLRLLTGELEPDAGSIERAERLRVVCFDQHREQLDSETTLRRALAPTGESVIFREQAIHVAGWARRFLFKPEQLELPVKDLSGGERARILIARLMLRPADLLLLDEPSNDLDIPSLEVLEASLADFPGALVLVTHDRFMLQRLATDILGLDGKGGAELFSDYAQWEHASAAQLALEDQAPKSASPKTALPNASQRAPKSGKRLSYLEQREWEQMEAAILQGEAAIKSLEKELEDPKVMHDPSMLQERCHALAEAHARVDGLY